MSPIARFTDACIRAAARRWPDHLADLLTREWHAELDHVRRDPQAGWPARIWRQLAFAVSLACSPAAGSESPLRWRTRLTGLGSAGERLVMLVGAGVLAYLAPTMGAEAWQLTVEQHRELSLPIWGAVSLTVTITLLTMVAMARLGSLAAGRIPIAAVRSGSTGLALRAALPTCGGYLLAMLTVARGNSGRDWSGQDIVAVAFWTVSAVAVLAAAIRLAHAGRLRIARAVACVGLFVVTDVAGVIAAIPSVRQVHMSLASAPLWLPGAIGMSGYFEYGTGSAFGYATGILHATIVPLLLLAAFLVTYVIRRRPAVAIVASIDSPALPRRAPWVSWPVRAYALGTAIFGLGLWTFLLAFATADFESPFLIPPILADGRIIAISIVLFAFAIGNAGRGPIAAPAATAGAVLLAVDHVVGNHLWRGPGVAVLLAVIVGGAIVAAWWVTPYLAGPGTTDTAARRALLVVALTASFGIPTAVQQAIAAVYGRHSDRYLWFEHPSIWMRPTPAVALVIFACEALLITTAVVAALASRRERLSVSRTAMVALGVAGLYVCGTVSPNMFHTQWIHVSTQPMIAIAVLAAARWPRAGYRPRAIALIVAAGVGAGIASPLLAGPLAGIGAIDSGLFPKVLTVFATTDPIPPLVLGLVLGLAFAARLVPSPVDTESDPDTAAVMHVPATA